MQKLFEKEARENDFLKFDRTGEVGYATHVVFSNLAKSLFWKFMLS